MGQDSKVQIFWLRHSRFDHRPTPTVCSQESELVLSEQSIGRLLRAKQKEKKIEEPKEAPPVNGGLDKGANGSAVTDPDCATVWQHFLRGLKSAAGAILRGDCSMTPMRSSNPPRMKLHTFRIQIVAEGLDPSISYLHVSRPDRPGLVLDLMEPHHG
jgi:hypothetical protein